MNFRTALLVVLSALTIASPVLAEDTAETYRQPNLMEMNEEQVAQLSPILQQIHGVLAAHLVETVALTAKIEASDAPLEVRALEQQIGTAKLDVEIHILEIQAEFARNEGRIAEAKQFADLAENLRHPAPREAVAATAQRQEVSR